MKRTYKVRESGFTLVELMVVVALLAILGLVTTSFNPTAWMAHYRLKSAAMDLSSNMQKARMNAIKENRDWSISFDPPNNTYKLQFRVSSTAAWQDSADNPLINLPNDYKGGIGFGNGNATVPVGASFGNGVTFGVAPNQRVIFNSSGLASTSGYCYLTNIQGASFAVGALTSGNVKMKKWNGAGWQ